MFRLTQGHLRRSRHFTESRQRYIASYVIFVLFIFLVGIPSLGVFPLDPLVINEINIAPNSNSAVNLKLHFKNINLHGVPTTTLSNYKANIKDAQLVSTAYTPKLWFDADYVSDGRILLLPIKGSGRCNISLNELETASDVKFTPQMKNGEEYWIINQFLVKFTPKKVTMYFDGILGNSDQGKSFETAMNQFLNENWKVIFDELRPSFEEAFGAVFKEITHRVFSKVPINTIFVS